MFLFSIIYCAFHKAFMKKSYLFLHLLHNCKTCFDIVTFEDVFCFDLYIKCSGRFLICMHFKEFKMVILLLKMSEEYQTAAWLHKLLVKLGLMG